LCDAGDAEALAGAIRRALEDEVLRVRVAGGAPARVRTMCDPAAVVGHVEELVRPHR
jgi:hypothetical protein